MVIADVARIDDLDLVDDSDEPFPAEHASTLPASLRRASWTGACECPDACPRDHEQD